MKHNSKFVPISFLAKFVKTKAYLEKKSVQEKSSEIRSNRVSFTIDSKLKDRIKEIQKETIEETNRWHSFSEILNILLWKAFDKE